jgi:SAM-dependent methyltransferase
MLSSHDDQGRGKGLPDWVPDGVDVTVPNPARIYDYALGGCHNFAVDREFMERAERVVPGAMRSAQANRAFLGRAVRWLIGAGIRQFLDIGSGIPTLGNVHEIAEWSAPDVRVMYVDIDPVAVAHTRAILVGNPRVGVLRADLRYPVDIIDHPDVRHLLDFRAPVAVIMASVLHFISDLDDPFMIVAQLRDAVVPGSYIALSHGTPTVERAAGYETLQKMTKETPTSFHPRGPGQIAQLFKGLELVEPGLVPVTDWRPDPDGDADIRVPQLLAAVGRKP